MVIHSFAGECSDVCFPTIPDGAVKDLLRHATRVRFVVAFLYIDVMFILSIINTV